MSPTHGKTLRRVWAVLLLAQAIAIMGLVLAFRGLAVTTCVLFPLAAAAITFFPRPRILEAQPGHGTGGPA